ncbi:sensor histidine kinase [Arthrobacter mobilis]|uniref:histidine kinase n=1 Tax=Arthrobacter mobilis TaxID=2724944 RepID=A0A7X6HA85_9MICC|nr:sensor histidine kinase [Arthrobacter mobilis]NKX53351.1 hypothetical protein [Arthrobacter mobilis]
MPASIRPASGRPAPAGAGRWWRSNAPRRQVLLGQLPLAAAVATVAAAAALFHPDRLANPFFAGGLVLLALLTLACAAVPWHRLPAGSWWIIPVLDFAVVGLLRQGSFGALSGLYLLAVFPVFRLAWSGLNAVAACLVSVAGTAAIVWLPALTTPGPLVPADLAAPVVVPVVMLALAVTAAVVRGSLTARNTALAARDRELRQLLAESRKHARLLDAVLDTVSVGVVAVDAGGRRTLMNSQQRLYHRLAAPAGDADPDEARLLVFEADRRTPVPVPERPVSRAARGESFPDRLVWLGPEGRQRAVCVTARAMKADNLLSNAIKYSPAGTEIVVTARMDPAGATFTVRDHGIGITAEDQAKVFSRFFRTRDVRQAAIPGVGLGLAITKSIVDAHDGYISFESRPGRGTAFTVQLPAAEPARAAPAVPGLRAHGG